MPEHSAKPEGIQQNSDDDLAVRAAWMHYAGGWTQTQVAEKLGLSKLKAHRLITRANLEGMVKVYIDGDVSTCLKLELELTERYQLNYCEVVPDFDSPELPLKALGAAGGQYLRRLLEGNTHSSIGIGHGRTMAACVENIPRTRNAKTQFYSLLGGFSRKFVGNPNDVIHRLAERTGAQAYVLPVPFAANSSKDKDVLMQQHGLKEVIDLARQTPMKFAGIGEVQLNSTLVKTEMLAESDYTAVKNAGGVGELLGHFFAADGSPVKTDLSRRTLGLSLDDIRGSQVMAVAGGTTKTGAIQALLNSGVVTGLITDETTAHALAAGVGPN